MLVCVSPPNLLNYSTDLDEIWYVNVFLSVDLNPIEKIRARSLFSPKIDFFERPINRFVIAYLRFLSKFGTLSDQLFIDYRGLTVRNGAKCATKPIPMKFGVCTCYLSVDLN